ncbi:SMAD/FHA domain [Ceraceosorus bombacis]|uniref:SMAD/FHA domain n=1 Tax=Ceraceosorus bombacis TaxID=401625 RepID=A0A0P1BHK3_9BASI|nr:SMAD/FHA domain [Ceraceosorus bombacis]
MERLSSLGQSTGSSQSSQSQEVKHMLVLHLPMAYSKLDSYSSRGQIVDATRSWSRQLCFLEDYGEVILARASEGTIIDHLDRSIQTGQTHFANKVVSRKHAKICWNNGVPSIVDLGSTHGTQYSDIGAYLDPYSNHWRVSSALAAFAPPLAFLKPGIRQNLTHGALITLGKDMGSQDQCHQAVRALIEIRKVLRPVSQQHYLPPLSNVSVSDSTQALHPLCSLPSSTMQGSLDACKKPIIVHHVDDSDGEGDQNVPELTSDSDEVEVVEEPEVSPEVTLVGIRTPSRRHNEPSGTCRLASGPTAALKTDEDVVFSFSSWSPNSGARSQPTERVVPRPIAIAPTLHARALMAGWSETLLHRPSFLNTRPLGASTLRSASSALTSRFAQPASPSSAASVAGSAASSAKSGQSANPEGVSAAYVAELVQRPRPLSFSPSSKAPLAAADSNDLDSASASAVQSTSARPSQTHDAGIAPAKLDFNVSSQSDPTEDRKSAWPGGTRRISPTLHPPCSDRSSDEVPDANLALGSFSDPDREGPHSLHSLYQRETIPMRECDDGNSKSSEESDGDTSDSSGSKEQDSDSETSVLDGDAQLSDEEDIASVAEDASLSDDVDDEGFPVEEDELDEDAFSEKPDEEAFLEELDEDAFPDDLDEDDASAREGTSAECEDLSASEQSEASQDNGLEHDDRPTDHTSEASSEDHVMTDVNDNLPVTSPAVVEAPQRETIQDGAPETTAVFTQEAAATTVDGSSDCHPTLAFTQAQRSPESNLSPLTSQPRDDNRQTVQSRYEPSLTTHMQEAAGQLRCLTRSELMRAVVARREALDLSLQQERIRFAREESEMALARSMNEQPSFEEQRVQDAAPTQATSPAAVETPSTQQTPPELESPLRHLRAMTAQMGNQGQVHAAMLLRQLQARPTPSTREAAETRRLSLGALTRRLARIDSPEALLPVVTTVTSPSNNSQHPPTKSSPIECDVEQPLAETAKIQNKGKRKRNSVDASTQINEEHVSERVSSPSPVNPPPKRARLDVFGGVVVGAMIGAVGTFMGLASLGRSSM